MPGTAPTTTATVAKKPYECDVCAAALCRHKSVVLDEEALQKMGDAQLKTGPDIEKAFGVDAPGAACSLQTLESSVSAEAVVAQAVGAVPDGNDLGSERVIVSPHAPCV